VKKVKEEEEVQRKIRRIRRRGEGRMSDLTMP